MNYQHPEDLEQPPNPEPPNLNASWVFKFMQGHRNLVLTMAFGASLILLSGIAAIVFENTLWITWLCNVGSNLGMAILGGGVFASIIQSIQLLGYFKRDLSDILTKDEFLRTRRDIVDLWYRTSGIMASENLAKISPELHTQVLKSYMPTNEDFYYENYKRTCIVDWSIEKDGTLEMREDTLMDIVPRSDATEITYEFKFAQSDGGANIPGSEVKISNTFVKIDGISYVEDDEVCRGKKRLANVKKDEDEGVLICSIKLHGEEKYHVHRQTVRRFNPLAEPYQKYFSRKYIKDATIMVQCIPDDLRVRFISLGTVNKFERIVTEGFEHRNRRGDIARSYQGFIFPHQGYLLIIQVLSEDILEKVNTEPGNQTRDGKIRAPHKHLDREALIEYGTADQARATIEAFAENEIEDPSIEENDTKEADDSI